MIRHEWFCGNKIPQEIFCIRTKVFVNEQNVPLERERIDEEDAKATHLLLYLDEKPVATGRILVINNKYTLGRIAVLKGYRGRGFGKLATKLLTQKCFEMGAHEVVLSSQYHAKDFYEQLGFAPCSEIYMDANIEHISMKIKKGRV